MSLEVSTPVRRSDCIVSSEEDHLLKLDNNASRARKIYVGFFLSSLLDRCVYMRTALIFSAAMLLSVASPAIAEDSPAKPNTWSIGATVGTLGAGGEASYLAYDYLVLRATASYVELGCSQIGMVYAGASCDHDYKITGLFAGGMMDIHPFQGGWRLSTGVRYTDLEAKASTKDSMTFNGQSYSSDQIGAVKITIKNSSQAAPYIGFGYDSSHYSESGAGIKLGFEVGALYLGDPSVSITTEKSIPGLSADIAKETALLKDDYGKYLNFYPIAMISARIAF
jgi:hypothetical protein